MIFFQDQNTTYSSWSFGGPDRAAIKQHKAIEYGFESVELLGLEKGHQSFWSDLCLCTESCDDGVGRIKYGESDRCVLEWNLDKFRAARCPLECLFVFVHKCGADCIRLCPLRRRAFVE